MALERCVIRREGRCPWRKGWEGIFRRRAGDLTSAPGVQRGTVRAGAESSRRRENGIVLTWLLGVDGDGEVRI